MSRTYRCKATAPTGTIVRDGKTHYCFDDNNIEFYCGTKFCITSCVFGRQINIFGVTDEDVIRKINSRENSIRRSFRRWRSKNHIDDALLKQQFKALSSRHGRRKTRERISNFTRYEISHENFDLHPSRPFMEIR